MNSSVKVRENNDIHVREWMKGCPYVEPQNVTRHGGKLLEYGIYPSPVQPHYHENVLGELIADEIQEARFILTAKLQYKDGNRQGYSFHQNVIDWIEEQNKVLNFPILNEGVVRSVNSSVFQYVSEPNKAMERNEIQIRFTYKRNNT